MHSYNNATPLGLDIEWGALIIDVYNESNMTQAIDGWNIEISDSESQTVYTAYDQQNSLYLDIGTIPFGDNTIFFITADGYRERISYHDLAENNFYDFDFYLPPYTTPTDEGGGDPGTGGDPGGGNVTTRLYRFRVIDEYTYPVAEATVQIRRYNNITGEYINISTLITNGYGEEDIWLIPGEHYRAFISKSDYDSDVFDWIPDPTFYGPDYPKVFQISRTISDDEEATYTFWDIIQFNATMHINGSLFVNYVDYNENTTDAQFYTDEWYNFSSTRIAVNSTTSNSYSFWLYGLNNSREHKITIFLNHSLLDFVVKVISVSPNEEATYDLSDIEEKISDGFGPFELGYVATFFIYVPVIAFLTLLGKEHPGFAIISASLYAGLITSFVVVGNIVMIIPFAIAIGMILMAVKGGMLKL